jgi:hypothetical protein
VLKPEKRDESDVDDCGDQGRRLGAGIDRNHCESEVSDKHDEVEKGRDEDRVAEHREEKRCNS